MRKIRNPNRADLIPLEPKPLATRGGILPAQQRPQPCDAAVVAPLEEAENAAKSGAARGSEAMVVAPAAQAQALQTPAKAEGARGSEAGPASGMPGQAVSALREDVRPEGAGAAELPGGARYEQAIRLTRKYAILAGGAGCIPLPGADVLTETGLQANLIEELSRLYGHTPTPGWALRLAGLLLFSTGWSAVGQVATWSLVKLIPGAGLLIGVGGLAAYTAATTYALGRSIIHYYENGGQPENLVCASVARDIRDGISAGREFWQAHRAQKRET